MARSDVAATTHKEKIPKKVISHIEIHPGMDGGHRVEVHHTQPFHHPPQVKHYSGPHDSVVLPGGHVLAGIAGHMGINTTGTGAGSEEPTEKKEAGVMS